MARWLRAVLVVCCVFGGLALVSVPVTGQPSDTPTTTAATNNSSSSSGGSVLPDLGSPVPDLGLDLDPWKFVAGMILGVTSSVASGVAGLLDLFNEFMFGVPAPGERTDPGTWTDPQNGNWPGVWTMYWLWASIGVLLLVLAWMLAHADGDRRQQRRLQTDVLGALALIVGGFPLVALCLHLGDALALAFAPSGSELLATPGDVGKLGLGVAVGAAILLINAGVIGVALLIVLAQHFALLALAAFWPLFVALRAVPVGALRSMGNIGISAFVALIIIKVLQGAVLRLLYVMTWDVGEGGALVVGLLATVVGLLIAFIGLPYAGFKKVVPGAAMVMGGRVRADGGRITDRARDAKSRVGDVRDRYQDARASRRSSSSPSRDGVGSNGGHSRNGQPTSGSRGGFTRARHGTGIKPASHASQRRQDARTAHTDRETVNRTDTKSESTAND